MKTEKSYLSEEELLSLIQTVEEEDLVLAPPDLASHILASLDDNSQKVAEFRRYCFRVIVSVAATLFLTFAIPDFEVSDTGFFAQAFHKNTLFQKDFDLNLFSK